MLTYSLVSEINTWCIACFCIHLLVKKIFEFFASSRTIKLCSISPQVALSGRYSRDYFNRHGDLRHIRRLRFWPLNKVLQEKYDFSEQDASDMADFLVPMLDFVSEKRPTAAQCLSHPWISTGPRLLQPSVFVIEPEGTHNSVSEEKKSTDDSVSEKKKNENDDREAMEVGVGNMAIDVDSKAAKESQLLLSSPK